MFLLCKRTALTSPSSKATRSWRSNKPYFVPCVWLYVCAHAHVYKCITDSPCHTWFCCCPPGVQTIDTCQAMFLPIGASISLLVMFLFFDSLQMVFAVCTAGGSHDHIYGSNNGLFRVTMPRYTTHMYGCINTHAHTACTLKHLHTNRCECKHPRTDARTNACTNARMCKHIQPYATTCTDGIQQ